MNRFNNNAFNRFSQNAKILSDKYGISPEIAVQVQQQLEGLGDDRGKLMRFIKKHKDKMDKDKNLKPLTLEQIKGFELDIDRSGGEYVWTKGISQDVREQDWLVKLLRNGRAKIGEDDFKLRDLLGKFNKVKMMSGFPNEKKDIMGYRDDGELFEEVSKWGLEDDKKSNNDKMVFEQGSKLLDRKETFDGELKLYEINTIEAILVAAKGTNWCVRDRRAAERYGCPYYYFSMDDEPYLLINKNDNQNPNQVKDVTDSTPQYHIIENVNDSIEKYNLNTHKDDFSIYDNIVMQGKLVNDKIDESTGSNFKELISMDNLEFVNTNNLNRNKENVRLILNSYMDDMVESYYDNRKFFGSNLSQFKLDTIIPIISKVFSNDDNVIKNFSDMVCLGINGYNKYPELYKRCSKLNFIKNSPENLMKLNDAANNYINSSLNYANRDYQKLCKDQKYYKFRGGDKDEDNRLLIIEEKKCLVKDFSDNISKNFNNTFFEKNKNSANKISDFMNESIKDLSKVNDYNPSELIGDLINIKEIRDKLSNEFYIDMIKENSDYVLRNGEFINEISLTELIDFIPDALLNNKDIILAIGKMISNYISSLLMYEYSSHSNQTIIKATILDEFERTNDLSFLIPERVRQMVDLSGSYCSFAGASILNIDDSNSENIQLYIDKYSKYKGCVKNWSLSKEFRNKPLFRCVSAITNMLYRQISSKGIDWGLRFLIKNKKELDELSKSLFYESYTPFKEVCSKKLVFVDNSANDNYNIYSSPAKNMECLELWKRYGRESFPEFFNDVMMGAYSDEELTGNITSNFPSSNFPSSNKSEIIDRNEQKEEKSVLARINWYNTFKVS